MAGHSKFANIQHRKGGQDKKRAQTFTKIAREIQAAVKLGGSDPNANPDAPFADLVDSMGLVEFIGLLAGDCGVRPEVIERAVGRRFSTLASLATRAGGASPPTSPAWSSRKSVSPASAETTATIFSPSRTWRYTSCAAVR